MNSRIASRLAPPRRRVAPGERGRRRQANGAVQRHPAHHLGLGEVQRARCGPPRCRSRAGARCGRRGRRSPASRRPVSRSTRPPASRVDQSGLQQVAVDVQLSLRRGGVADPDRARPAVAVQLQRALGRALAAVEAVEHLQARVGQLRRVQQPPEERLGLASGSPAAGARRA